ncbi:class I SAM-dependent methyltransferase [Candidatus Pelagibacter sp.]|nr:class I SAM-dependent methyltransferase [Candidatus Pelagibacter sp.]
MNFFSLFKRNLIFRLKKKINIDNHNSFRNTSLDFLFNYYNTDKGSVFNKNLGSGFTKFYEKHLNKFKNDRINILEIGSYSGASAAAFAKYFPNSKIYCLDINLRNFIYSSNRIFPFGIDSSNKKMLLSFLNKIDFFKKIKFFDIIIDDGSHMLSDQLFSLNYFYRYVKKNGFYIIEDYCFPEYFERNNNIKDYKISEIINFINNRKNFSSTTIREETVNEIKLTIKKIYSYKGNTHLSDIAFFEKN